MKAGRRNPESGGASVSFSTCLARACTTNLLVMFILERKFADKPRKQRERMRASKVKVLVDRHFALCREHEATVLEGTPLAAAVRYSLKQEAALRRFLADGRLSATNRISEKMLRRQAMGWLRYATQAKIALRHTSSAAGLRS
jgi:hypothetical protein